MKTPAVDETDFTQGLNEVQLNEPLLRKALNDVIGVRVKKIGYDPDGVTLYLDQNALKEGRLSSAMRAFELGILAAHAGQTHLSLFAKGIDSSKEDELFIRHTPHNLVRAINKIARHQDAERGLTAADSESAVYRLAELNRAIGTQLDVERKPSTRILNVVHGLSEDRLNAKLVEEAFATLKLKFEKMDYQPEAITLHANGPALQAIVDALPKRGSPSVKPEGDGTAALTITPRKLAESLNNIAQKMDLESSDTPPGATDPKSFLFKLTQLNKEFGTKIDKGSRIAFDPAYTQKQNYR